MDYFSSLCGETNHVFMRDDEDAIQAYHHGGYGDYILCESAEFGFTGMLNDEVDRAHNCPGCDKVADQDHIRKCIGYRTPATVEEIKDAYSDSTEQAKRNSLLAECEAAMNATRHLD